MHHLEPQVISTGVDTMRYYSAPCSPIRKLGSGSFGYESETPKTNEDCNSNYDFFEFATVPDFDSGYELEEGMKGELVSDDERGESKNKQVERVGSLRTMAFADELFSNGLVKPLKLPPRLQYRDDVTCRSQTFSPMSVIKVPFTRRNVWNDDFDPFMVALERVKDEKRGRKSVYRRARSHSPYRATSLKWPIDTEQLDRPEEKKEGKEGPIANGLAAPKGAAYARWARNESMRKNKSSFEGSSPKSMINFKAFSFGQKVQPVRMGPGGSGPIDSTTEEGGNAKGSEKMSNSDTNKMDKVKGIISKYASFGKQKSERKLTSQLSAIWKPTYLKKMSFISKGSGRGSGNKKFAGESKMDIVPHRPNKFTLCLGYGGESPRN